MSCNKVLLQDRPALRSSLHSIGNAAIPMDGGASLALAVRCCLKISSLLLAPEHCPCSVALCDGGPC